MGGLAAGRHRDPGFRRENFYDRTFWDTFCLASRQVFDQVSYVPTSAASGLGPEDWHWGMETVHAGFEHLVAPATALLYRVKPTASVQQGHDEARSLLPPAGLLVDGSVAALRPAQPDDAATDDRAQLRGLQAAIVRPRPERRRAPRALTWLRRDAGPPDDFDVAHYRALNSDALHLDDDAAARHHLTVGRAEGRRGLLTPEELADVQRLRLDDYRTLHPDLAALTDDDLLHHYLLHGRVEGRAARMTTEQRDAARPVRLAPEVVAELAELHTLEPDVPEPTPEALAALRHVGPPMDGSVTAGSRRGGTSCVASATSRWTPSSSSATAPGTTGSTRSGVPPTRRRPGAGSSSSTRPPRPRSSRSRPGTGCRSCTRATWATGRT